MYDVYALIHLLQNKFNKHSFMLNCQFTPFSNQYQTLSQELIVCASCYQLQLINVSKMTLCLSERNLSIALCMKYQQ